ncbi:MAG: hypothetical protein J5I92_14400 [Thiogranum sp.]|nr:hypothetical protein [Thiogranum sp.]
MKTLVYIAFCLMALVATPMTSAAQGMPEFETTGTIDRLDLKAGEIVVDDTYYRLGKDLIIHDAKGRLGGTKLLREGVRIGISPSPLQSGATRSRTVYEVWVLPKDYEPRKTDEE